MSRTSARWRSSAPRRRVAVLGAGSWGTTFAKILADGGADVDAVGAAPRARARDQRGQAQQRLPAGHQPAAAVTATPSLAEALAGAEQVFVSVPSQTLRENLAAIRAAPARATPSSISLMKGVEKGTGLRMSEVHRAGAGDRPRAHRRGLRAQPRPRDREGAADGRRRLVGRASRPPQRVAMVGDATATSARS